MIIHSLDFATLVNNFDQVLAANPTLTAWGLSDALLTNSGSVDSEQKLKANFVLLEHVDGSLTLYAHLAPKPVELTLGGLVNTGELIGYSGNTGFSSGPHLHFALCKALP